MKTALFLEAGFIRAIRFPCKVHTPVAPDTWQRGPVSFWVWEG